MPSSMPRTLTVREVVHGQGSQEVGSQSLLGGYLLRYQYAGSGEHFLGEFTKRLMVPLGTDGSKGAWIWG